MAGRGYLSYIGDITPELDAVLAGRDLGEIVAWLRAHANSTRAMPTLDAGRRPMARHYVSNTAPATGEELARLLAGDPADIGRWMKISTQEAGSFQAQLAGNLADAGALDRQVQEETQRVLAQLLREGGVQNDAVKRLDLSPSTAPGGRGGMYNKAAPGARVDQARLFQTSGDYFQTIWHNNRSEDAAKRQSMLHQIRASLGTTVPSEGGFLVPETLRSDLLMASLETSIVRPRASVIPMGTLRVPIPAIDDTSHASSVFGGLVGYWTEESAQLTESQPAFGRIVLDAKKLTMYCEVPNELMADAPALGGFVDVALPAATSFYEDLAFLRGSGVGEPLGVLNGSGLVSVNRTTANRILWVDILAMVARLLPSSLRRAVWVASPATLPQLGNLQSIIQNVAASENVGGGPIMITDGSADAPTSILGRPLLFSEKVPTLGTAGDLSLVDFSYYLLGDRQAMEARSSEHFKFQNDRTALRVIERVDGRPWLNSAITPSNGGATLSPYVRLS